MDGDSQRNMRSVCWRPLIASNTASLASSSFASAASFGGAEGGRRLNFATQDSVRALGWPRDGLIGNSRGR
jgi:hypothetical protein